MKITWDENIVKIPTIQRKRARVRRGIGTFYFDELNIARGGLLEEALFHYEGEALNRAIYHQTLLGLKAMSQNPEAILILSSRSNQLERHHIFRLFILIEEHIATLLIKHKNGASTQYRHIFTKFPLPLKNGDKIIEIGFRSRFLSDKAFEFKVDKGLLNQDKIIVTEHEDEQSLHKKVLETMKTDLEEVESACWDIVQRYKRVFRRHKKILSHSKNSDSSKDELSKILHKIQEEKFFLHDNVVNSMMGNDITTLTELLCKSPMKNLQGREFEKIPCLPFEEMFLIYYLPKSVVEAIEVLFIIYTGWNPDVVVSISSNDINRYRGQFEIGAIKSKNDQEFHTRVVKKENPRFYEIISIILRNNKNINKYWRRHGSSIFSTWHYIKGDMAFRTMGDSEQKTRIIKPYGLFYFSKKQLRDQKINILYLESEDPFQVKEMLGHVRLETSLSYLNQHIIRLLHEANVRRFQDILAASVTWAIGGESAVHQRGMKVKDIDERLLFPIGRDEVKSHAICDEWINSLGKKEFLIGRDEINHLIWQRDYYLKNMAELRQDNPKQFLLNHVPRILFCFALHEFVKTSNYSKLLNGSGNV